ncbi:MAG: LysR family transcriptional regulator [Alphaproteobacteria bacterium]|nr:LysR family transcriptional regulator [Alphaproteobacteria bacterium]
MEMHQVRYFLAVCRTLNFTKAAEECNVAQPSLTRAVQKLEEEFGGLLFHRERANTHLTELGRAMLPHLERTYEAAQSAKQLASGFKKGEVAHLRLGVSGLVSADAVASVLGHVQKAVPAVELTLGSGPDGKLLDDAVAGDFDIVVVGDSPESPERLRSWTLHREPLVVVMAPSHALAEKDKISIADLADVDLIELLHCPIGPRFQEMCAASGVKLKIRTHAANCAQTLSLAREGLGIAVLPMSMATGPGLVVKPLAGTSFERSITLGTVAGRRFTPASDAFVKLARSRDWSGAA